MATVLQRTWGVPSTSWFPNWDCPSGTISARGPECLKEEKVVVSLIRAAVVLFR